MKNLFLFLFIFTVSAIVADAQITSAGNYSIEKSVVSGSGGTGSSGALASGNYLIEGTIGQAAAGTNQQNAGYKLQPGFWTAQSCGPTAAEVTISGRVLTADGKGLVNAYVIIKNTGGQNWTVRTSAFGNFRFDGLQVGETIIISISSKKYTFAPQLVTLTNDISGLTLTAQ